MLLKREARFAGDASLAKVFALFTTNEFRRDIAQNIMSTATGGGMQGPLRATKGC